MMPQGHVEVLSFNLDRADPSRIPSNCLAESHDAGLVAIAPNVPEAKILLQKNAAKQPVLPCCRQIDIGPGGDSARTGLELGRRIPIARKSPLGPGFPNGRDQRRRDRLPDPIAQNDGSAQSGRRQRVGRRGLLEDGGGACRTRLRCQAASTARVAQNGIGREGEFMCEKRRNSAGMKPAVSLKLSMDEKGSGLRRAGRSEGVHLGAEKLRRRSARDRAWIDTKKRFADFGSREFWRQSKPPPAKQITGRELVALAISLIRLDIRRAFCRPMSNPARSDNESARVGWRAATGRRRSGSHPGGHLGRPPPSHRGSATGSAGWLPDRLGPVRPTLTACPAQS